MAVDVVGAIAPARPVLGGTWLDTSNLSGPVLRVYDGTDWVRALPEPVPGYAPIDVSTGDIAVALRVVVSPSDLIQPELTIIARLGAMAQELVNENAPNAPPPVRAESIIRICGYVYDAPSSAAAQRFANAWVNSGAAALCNPWVVRRAITGTN